MDKKEQLEFLKEALKGESRNRLLAELNNRIAHTKALEGKVTPKINEQLAMTQNQIDAADLKIRHLKTLIKETEDDKFAV